MTEQEIIQGLLVKDKDAFSAVYNRLYRQLCYFANGIINDEEEAKDAVMDGFTKLWNHRKQFESIRHIENYLYQDVKRRCQMYIRKVIVRANHKDKVIKLGYPLSENDIEKKYQESEIVIRIYNQINKLPSRMQQAFKLMYIEGHSRAEVAEIMQVSENTARNLVERAKAAIRKSISEKELLVTSVLLCLCMHQS